MTTTRRGWAPETVIEPPAGPRAERLIGFAAVCIFGLVALEAVWLAVFVMPSTTYWALGQDYAFYRDLGARWLADGSFYLPRQLAGPYVAVTMIDVLYPPNALYLFVPFAVLPAVLWWAVPIGVSVYVLSKVRPEPWAWLVMGVLLLWPRAIGAYLFGNTDMWAVAAILAGIRWGWPAALLVLKPTYAPLALLFGRRAWAGLAAVALLSLPMLPLWFDYLDAMVGPSIPLEYSLGSVPLLLVPLVAWLGRSSSSPTRPVGTEPTPQLLVQGRDGVP